MRVTQVERASVRGSPPLGGEQHPAGKRYAGDPGRERGLRWSPGRAAAEIPLRALPDHVSKNFVTH
jgi:hypothetical protein